MLPAHVRALLAALLFLGSIPSLPGGGPKREPSPAEVFSGNALNDLLREIAAAHAKGRRGPKVVLDPDILKQVNVAPAGGGNFGLLRNGGKLTWPVALAEEPFRGDREKAQARILKALQAPKQEPAKPVARATLDALNGALERLGGTLRKEINEILTSQYLAARRYLNDLGDAVTALQGPAAARFVDGTYAARGKTVEELVDHLRRHGLTFAAAVGGQEAAYQTVYAALRAYHAGLSAPK